MKPVRRLSAPTLPAKRLRKLLVGGIAILLALAAPRRAGADAADLPGTVADALQTALAVPAARLDVVAWKGAPASRCTPESATVERAVTGSGRYAVKIDGPGCSAWGWATVRVFAPAFVTTRSVRAGELLDHAIKSVDQEVRAGRAPANVNPGAKAARPLGSGQLVEAAHLESAGPAPGSPIKVLVRAGSLGVTQYGRAISCGRGRTCAVLPSGKHVEGNFVEGTLLVEMP